MSNDRSSLDSAVGREVKDGDVYRFQYHPKERQPGHDPYWCFDGQLVAMEQNGGVVLVDTYYGFEGRYDGPRRFTLEEAIEQGTMTYVCSLPDLEPAQPYETRYYDEADLFDLSYQHRCYRKLMKRKGAKRSREAMYRALANDRKEAEEQLRSAISKLEWIARTRQVVEDATDLNKVYP